MTVLNAYIVELNTALQKVLKWPYKQERVDAIVLLIFYLQEQLNEPHNMGSDAP